MDDTSFDPKRKRFVWGTVLTWTLSTPILIAMFYAFRGLAQEKATGLGEKAVAVAGGFVEGYATFGIILAFVLPVLAIVLLVRSFSGGHRIRSLFSLVYIGWSALTLVLASAFLWMSFIYLPHIARAPR
jgi:hypothetical protein